MEDGQVHRPLDRLAKGVRRPGIAARQQVGRVLSLRHPRDVEAQPPAARHSLGAQHRLAPGPVGVERQHRLLGVTGEQLHLLGRDRGAHHPDRVPDPSLVASEHVGVALDDHGPARLRDRRPRPVYPVQRAPLAVQLPLRRVDVLGLLVREQRPRPESLHPPASVADREHDPRAEAVVVPPALLAAQHQPRRLDLLDRVAGLLPADQHRVPGPGRAPDPELLQHLAPEPARGEVLAGALALRRVATGTSRRRPRCARAARRAGLASRGAPGRGDPRPRARARPRSGRRAPRRRRRRTSPPSPRRTGSRRRPPRTRSSGRASPAGRPRTTACARRGTGRAR